MERRRVVRVPASSANLGPGFDVLAAALSLRLEVEVVETGTFAIETDLDIARDRRNLIVRAFERLHPSDGFTFRIQIGDTAVGRARLQRRGDRRRPDRRRPPVRARRRPLQARLRDRGPSRQRRRGDLRRRRDLRRWTATRIEPPTGLEGLLVVPHEPVRTAAARAALPKQVPMADAVHNVAHVALLTLGLARGDWDLVARGLDDRLHEPHRAHLYPKSAELVQDARKLGALGATISGAGPTVLVWSHYEQTAAVAEALRERAEGWAQVLRVPFETQGADVVAVA